MGSALSQSMADRPRQDLLARAFTLAVRVFKLYPRLAATSPAHAHVARQLLRSVTAIGALLEEGIVANSRRDMAAKYAIALRESRESNYWSRIIATDEKWAAELAPIIKETGEFTAMLTVSVRKLRAPIESGQRAEGRAKGGRRLEVRGSASHICPSTSLCPLPSALLSVLYPIPSIYRFKSSCALTRRALSSSSSLRSASSRVS